MPLIEWTQDLSVGIREFDEHHRSLIALINRLQEAVGSPDDRTVVAEVLGELANYTMYHFFAEEDAMQKWGYPGYREHRIEHLQLTDRTLSLLGDLHREKAAIGQEVLVFLMEWLRNHILVTDRKYEPFFHEKGLS